MAQIIPKLNLNKTPRLIDNNSLIFAKNIKLDKDGTIVKDDGIVSAFDISELVEIPEDIRISLKIVGYIVANSGFYIFLSNYRNTDNEFFSHYIVYYSEKNGITYCDTAWTYNGGTINGNVIENIKKDKILTITESNANVDVPIKTINLTYSSKNDDESIYTSCPVTPFVVLSHVGYCFATIKNGTYQFFIRFKITDKTYTPWQLCSKELFAGTKTVIEKSSVGSFSYINTNKDSSKSFVFDVDIVSNTYKYEYFQLAYMISNDNVTVSRIWKEFPITTKTIYFSYLDDEIEEIDNIELLESQFNIYNVENITYFKNKQYVSNYKETNFNPDLQEYANNIDIELEFDSLDDVDTRLLQDDYGYYYAIGESNTRYFYDITCNLLSERQNSIETDTETGGLLDKLYDEIKETNVSINNINDIVSTDIEDADSTILEHTEIKEQYSDILYSRINDVLPGTGISDEDIQVNDILLFVRADVTDAWNYGDNQDSYPALNRWRLYEQVGAYDYRKMLTYANVVDGNTQKFYFNEHNLNTYSKFNYYYFIFVKKESNNVYKALRLQTSITIIENVFNFTSLDYDNLSTLLPYQTYKFYVHYVKDSGEITNGFPIQDANGIDREFTFAPEENGTTDDYNILINHYIIYPSFTDITIPDGYSGCFFTIQRYKGFIIELTPWPNGNFDNIKVFSSVELDSLTTTGEEFFIKAFNNNGSPKLYDSKVDNIVGKYFGSDNPSNLYTFGGDGYVVGIDKDDNNNYTDITNNEGYVFAYTEYINTDKFPTLVRCTPIIYGKHNLQYDSFKDMNLLGYICKFTKSNVGSSKFITSGQIYTKNVNGNQIQLVKESNNFKYGSSDYRYVYSNYNLNMLSRNPEVNLIDNIESTENTQGSSSTISYLTEYINSQQLSSFYTLEPMYKSYLRKTYEKVNKDNMTIFTNTIRSSRIIEDESIIYNFKYNSGDYYNCPTDKGKITNLISVGNEILVHTEDSLYRFSGANSLTANGGEEIQTKETDIFDSGIQEIFGSTRGFAGLQDKTNSIVTQGRYYFYDSDSKMIYCYSGGDNIAVISEEINKLMKTEEIENVYFANDFYNNKLYVNIKFTTDFVTLSYNPSTKSFISLHDFNFEKAINTKINCYFAKNKKIYKLSNIINTYDDLTAFSKKYPTFGNNLQLCVIDIIYNINYEHIKALDYLNWICSKITNFGTENSNVNIDASINDDKFDKDLTEIGLNSFVAEETLDRTYAGDKLMIYTDSTYSGVLDLSITSNDKSIASKDYFIYPRYNLGSWSLNYFKDIKNIEDLWNYTHDTKIDSNSSIKAYNNANKVYPDMQSELYGKYLVARFIFNRSNNFKLESVQFNVREKI